MKEWNIAALEMKSVYNNNLNVKNVLVKPTQKVFLNENLFMNTAVTSNSLLDNSTVDIITSRPDLIEIIEKFTSSNKIPRLESNHSVYNNSIEKQIPDIISEPQYSAEKRKNNLQTQKSISTNEYTEYTEMPYISTTLQPFGNIVIKNNSERNNSIQNDTEITLRLLNHDFDNSKNNLNRTNISVKSDINMDLNLRHSLPTMGFQKLIGSMVNNLSKNITNSHVFINNTDKNAHTYLFKENITKIVQSSMDKNKNKFSFTTIFPHRNLITTTEPKNFSNNPEKGVINDNLRIYKDSKSSLAVYDDLPDENDDDLIDKFKLPNSNEVSVIDSNIMLHLNQILQNIFSHNNKSHDHSTDFTILPVKGYKDNIQSNLFTIASKINNNKLYRQRLGTRKMRKNRKNFPSKNTVQSLYNNRNEYNVKFNDVINAFENNLNELNSKNLMPVGIANDLSLALDKKHVKPWNALISRLFESLNTKLHFNETATKIHVKNNS